MEPDKTEGEVDRTWQDESLAPAMGIVCTLSKPAKFYGESWCWSMTMKNIWGVGEGVKTKQPGKYFPEGSAP